MTLIIGIRCADGIVVGADSASSNNLTQQVTARKLEIHHGNLVVGVAGMMGFGQRLSWAVANNYLALSAAAPGDVSARLADALRPVLETEIRNCSIAANAVGNQQLVAQAIDFGLVCGLPVGKVPELLFVTATLTPSTATARMPIVCAGNGQQLAEPFMLFVAQVLWQGNRAPSRAEAILGIKWTMRHVFKIHPGGVGGDVQMVEIRPDHAGGWTAEELDPASLQEHDDAIDELHALILDWRRRSGTSPASASTAAIPSPTAATGASLPSLTPSSVASSSVAP